MPEISHWHRADRTKRCIACDEVKPLGEFYAYGYLTNQGKQSTRYESRCKECARERRLGQYRARRDDELRRMKEWREANTDHRISYSRKRQADPAVKRLKAYHQRLRKARMRSVSGDDEAIRAIYAEAMRAEQVIRVCPVFDLPELGKKLHVDHIIPLALGGRHEARNLQILPAGLNMRKGAKPHSAWTRETVDASDQRV